MLRANRRRVHWLRLFCRKLEHSSRSGRQPERKWHLPINSLQPALGLLLYLEELKMQRAHDARGCAIAKSDQAQQQVLWGDAIVAEALRLFLPEQKCLASMASKRSESILLRSFKETCFSHIAPDWLQTH